MKKPKLFTYATTAILTAYYAYGNPVVAAMTDAAQTGKEEAIGVIKFVVPTILFVFFVIGLFKLSRGPAALIVSLVMIGLYVGASQIMSAMGLDSPI